MLNERLGINVKKIQKGKVDDARAAGQFIRDKPDRNQID